MVENLSDDLPKNISELDVDPVRFLFLKLSIDLLLFEPDEVLALSDNSLGCIPLPSKHGEAAELFLL